MVKVNQSNRMMKLVGANIFFFGLIAFIFFIGVPSGDIFKTFTSNVYSTYTIMALACLLLIDILFVIEVLIHKKDEKYGDGLLFVSQGELPSVDWFSKISNVKLLFGSICLMSILSTVIFIIFGDMGKISSTSTPLIDLFLILLENVMLMVLLASEVFVLRAIARKHDWSKGTFMGLVWTIVLITSAGFGWIMHIYSKVGNIGELTYSAVFWGFMGVIHLITGSIFAPTGFHFILDLPFFLNIVFSDAWVITIFLTVAFVSGFLTFRVKSKNIAVENTSGNNEFIPNKFPKQVQKVYEEVLTD